MFEQLNVFIKGHGSKNVFDDLLNKSMKLRGLSDDDDDLTGFNIRRSTPKKTEANQGIVSKKVRQISGIATENPSPVSADVHTNTTLDNTKIKQQRLVVTPKGTQNKTVHVSAMDDNTSIMPRYNNKSKVGNNKTKTKKVDTKTNKIKETNGFNPDPAIEPTLREPKIEVPPKKVSIRRAMHDFYKNKIKPGHLVYWNGSSSKVKDSQPIPVFSEALGDDGKHVIVKPKIYGDKPIKVPYHHIIKFKQPKPENPEEVQTIQYPGEIHALESDQDDKPVVVSKMTPEEHAAERLRRQKLTKVRIKNLVDNLRPGNTVEFKNLDPKTNKLGIDAGEIQEIIPKNNTAIVHTKNGKIQIPLEDIERVEYKMPSGYYLHKFDPDKGSWVLDNGDVSPTRDVTPTEETESSDEIEGNQTREPRIEKPDAKTIETIASDHGLEILDDDDGELTLLDPESGRKYIVNSDEVTDSKLRELTGKSEPKPPIEPEWHTLDKPSSVRATKRDLERIDEMHDEGIPLPSFVLSARHTILNPNSSLRNVNKAQVMIQNFLSSPRKYANGTPEENIEEIGKGSYNPLSDYGPEYYKKVHPVNKIDADPYLAKRQGSLLHELREYADKNKTPWLEKYVSGLDPSKDNSRYLKYLTSFLKKAKGIDVNNALPKNRDLEDMRHIHELESAIEKEGLRTPFYNRRIKELKEDVKNGEDPEEISKNINDLHNYLYYRGEEDPHYIANALYRTINKKHNGKFLPLEDVRNFNDLFEDVYNGWEPHRVNKLAKDYLSDKGIDPSQETKPYRFRTGENRERIFGKEEKPSHPLEPSIVKPKQEPEPSPVLDPEQQKVLELNKFKASQSKLKNDIQRKKDLIDTIKESYGGRIPKEHKTLYDSTLDSLKQLTDEYNNNVSNHSERLGIQPDYIDEPVDDEETERKSSDIARFENNREDYKRYMKTNVQHYLDKMNFLGHNFLRSSYRYDPKTQIDVRNINKLMEQKIANKDFTPLPEDLGNTDQGRLFVNKVNESLAAIKDSEKLYGISADQVLKSQQAKQAEKILCRRDVGIAMRKAFFDNKDDETINKAISVVSDFMDKFVDHFMDSYKSISVEDKKYMLRKISKSIINDVVKENEFVAENMSSDYTCPINDSLIKSMGAHVASITTEFISAEENKKPVLYIDLNKSENHVSALEKSIARAISLTEVRSKLGKKDWLIRLVELQDIMYKIKLVKAKVSKHKIVKFVQDNNDKTLEEFYNSSVRKIKGLMGVA